MAKPKDITGQRFGKLVAIERTDRQNRKKAYYWKCECDCGNTTEVTINNLTSGQTNSCGCQHKKPPVHIKHGRLTNGKRERLYNIWVSMKQRCFNENDKNYFRYGGRGITVCDEWENDYEVFRKWCLENGYEKGLDLDREDNNGNYTPSNCRFVTHQENLLNTHRAKKYREVTKC